MMPVMATKKKVLPPPSVDLPADGPVPYQCFMSYRRDDNTDFDGVVDVLQKQLAGRFDARTGTELKIFVDRKDIGWGAGWRQKIADSIAGSTLFIPIITMRYFKSAICREELQAFLAAARQQGVTELVLPIVLAGSQNLTDENEDDLVRQVAELNCKFIEADWERNYQSAEWKSRVGELVRGIEEALSNAADQLSAIEALASGATDSSDQPGAIDEIDFSVIMDEAGELTKALEAVSPPMNQMQKAIEDRIAGRDLDKMSPGQQKFFFGALAKDLTDPAKAFEAAATDTETKAVELDAKLRAMIFELEQITSGESKPLTEGIQAALGDLDGLEASTGGFADIDRTLRRMALSSVELRKATRPISRGLVSYATALKVLDGWKTGAWNLPAAKAE